MTSALDWIAKGLAALVSTFLGVLGLRWLIDPEGAAAMLGMELLTGAGGNTQIGDLAGFFLLAGLFGWAGLIRNQRILLLTPAALMLITAFSRTVAWLVHGAGPALQAVIPELIMCALLMGAWVRMKPNEEEAGS